MRSNGTQLKIISYQLGVSLPTVGKYLKSAGLVTRSKNGRKTHKERKCLICHQVQLISVWNRSKVCRPCEDNRKRGLKNANNLIGKKADASRQN